MNRLGLIALVTVCLAGNAVARLGETEAQCEARYGKYRKADRPTAGSDQTLFYSKNGVQITAEFRRGQCMQISYTVDSWVQLPRDQVDAIFEANGGKTAWSTFTGAKKGELVRADGRALARVWFSGVSFTLNEWQKAHVKAVKDAEAAKKAAAEEAAKQRVKGF